MSEGNPASYARIGPIWLSPGVSPAQAFRYIGVASILACLGSFMAIIQPYVFTEQLHIPTNEQGRLAGNLAGTQQIAGLIFVALLGALSDRLGRKLFLVLAMIGMTAAILLYPFATMIFHLFVLRFVFGFGSACNTAGGPAMRLDLTHNNSRGRFLSLSQVFQAAFITVFVSLLGTRLPAWLGERSMSAADAGRYTMWVIGLLGLAGILLAIFGLRKDRPPAPEAKTSPRMHLAEMLKSMREVLAYAKVNRRFRLLLMASAVLRADGLVIGSFLALWVVNAGRLEGLTTMEAMKAFSVIAVVLSVTDVVFGVAAGFLADRLDRMRMLVCAVLLTAVAFSLTLVVPSVTGVTIILVVAFINLGEALQLSASQSLIGEVTPPHLRGAAYGMFAWIGMISVVIISFICGYLFDKLGYKTPFLLMAGLSFTYVAFAVTVLYRGRREPQSVHAAS